MTDWTKEWLSGATTKIQRTRMTNRHVGQTGGERLSTSGADHSIVQLVSGENDCANEAAQEAAVHASSRRARWTK